MQLAQSLRALHNAPDVIEILAPCRTLRHVVHKNSEERDR